MKSLTLALLALLLPGTTPAAEVALAPMFPTGYGQSHTGACFHEGSMWGVTKGNVMILYDSETGEMLEVHDPMIGGLAHSHIHSITPTGSGTFWAVEVHSRTLYELRFSDLSVVSTLPAPDHPAFGLSFRDGLLWVGYHSDGPPRPIHGVDPETGAVVEVLDFGSADVHGMAWVGDYLWVMDSVQDTLFQVDRSGQVRNVFALPFNTWASLAWDGSRLWTSDLDTFYHIKVPREAFCPPPTEVTDVLFTTESTLAWSEPVSLGGSSVVYDVIRSDDPTDFSTLASCIETADRTASTIVDGETPFSGAVFFYLVRASNLCPEGPGLLGVDSSGEERQALDCR